MIIYTNKTIAEYISMCESVGLIPSVEGLVDTETQTLHGDEARDVEIAVRAAWVAYSVR